MEKSRLQMLEKFVNQDPKDSFSRYGLAMEYIQAQRYAEGLAQFHTLIQNDPDYVPTYFQMGRAYEHLGQIEAARHAYEQGIATCRRTGQQKALHELENALEQLSGFNF